MWRHGALSVVLLAVQVLSWIVGALDCTRDSNFVIRSTEDLSIINKCTFFNGSVTVSQNAPRDIEFRGIRSMRKLEVESIENIRSISSHSLESVDNIRLIMLPNLVYLNLSTLNVLEEMRLENLPSFENCSLGLGPRNKASIINTGLQMIDWLKWPVTTALNITGNANLESVSLPWDVISGNVTMKENKGLRNMSASAVKDVTGSFILEGNEDMKEFTFQGLETIEGEVNLSGAFINISIPALKSIEGALKLESSQNISEICNGLVKKKLRGQFECKAKIIKEDPRGSAFTPSDKPSDDSEPSPNEPPGDQDQSAGTDMALGAKIGILLASLILVIFVFIGIFFLIRARIRGKVMEIVPTAPGTPMVVSKSGETVVIPSSEGRTLRLVKNKLNREVKENDTGKATIAQENLSVGKEIGRESSLRSVSSLGSAGSGVSTTEKRSPMSPVSPM